MTTRIWAVLALLIGLSMFLSQPAEAQRSRHADVWTFGNHCRLSWNADATVTTPTRDPSIVTAEGTASFSDPETGDLLIYSDGSTVWNAAGTVIATGLPGHNSSIHSAVIVPRPLTPDRIFVIGHSFNNTRNIGFREFDVSNRMAPAPLGSNTFVDLDGGALTGQEGMLVVPHTNGVDWWVIVHGVNSVFVLPVTITGVGSPTKIITGVNNTAPNDVFTAFAISNDGERLMIADRDGGSLYSFDFDPSTGVVDGRTLVATLPDGQKYGGAFSPDDTKFYFASLTGVTNLHGRLFQYDFTASALTMLDQQETRYTHSQARLGPDGRIYVSTGRRGGAALTVIENPNDAAADITVSFANLPMAMGCDPQLGLPQTVSPDARLTLGVTVNAPSGAIVGTTTAPSGAANLPDGATISVTVTDADGYSGMCTATVTAGTWACAPGSITGLPVNHLFTTTATHGASSGSLQFSTIAACTNAPSLVNGSFEDGANGTGLTELTGWLIELGEIDHSSYPHSDGARAIDLTACSPGTISQVVATTSGVTYTVSTEYGSNSVDGNEFALEAIDTVSSALLQSASFASAATVGTTLTDTGSITFAATGPFTRIRLRTVVNNGACAGNWIDNVRMEAVAGSPAPGCSAAAPFCDTSGATAICIECEGAGDCDDSNDCTQDLCSAAGVCSNPAETTGTLCAGGVCDAATRMCIAVRVDLTAPSGAQVSTSITPSGTSTAPNGSTVTVSIPGAGTCTGTVMMGAFTCSSSITLSAGEDYVATATVTVSGVMATDSENLSVGPCVGQAVASMCTDNRGAGTTTGVCSAAGAAGICVGCVDNGTGAMTDAGCMDSAPICEVSMSGGSGSSCTACLDDTTGGTDLGCGADAPVCDDSGATDICVSCEDDATGNMEDNGCMGGTPVCLEPLAMAPMCVECSADAHCPAMGEVCGGDNTCVPGCDEASDCAGTDLPICDTVGRTCVECLTNADCNGDEVCSAGGTCGQPDSDGDNIPDDVDIDDDNDGIPDAVETDGTDYSLDSDDDGWPDYKDPDSVICDDADADGACDALPVELDFDQDGIPNHLDLDADGDGIADVSEAGGDDVDGNGLIDGFVDADGNGMADSVDTAALATPDTDMDMSPDFLDRDADGDGLTDTFEAGGVDADGNGIPDGVFADVDGDGLDDNLTGGGALPRTDTDNDGTPDFQDVDADGDGVPDAIEGHGSGDMATAPSGTDTDGDGIDDAFDPDCVDAAVCAGTIGVIAPIPNVDEDGMPDFRDIDADGDGITDGVECPLPAMCANSDMMGRPDFRSLDADGDGLPDAQEGHDANHDGVADVVPTGNDSDGDGLDDAFDADCSADAPCGPDATVGVPAPTPDLDMDDIPDFQDVDDDGDAITTAQEIADAADYPNHAGMSDSPTDIDEDDLPNWYDTDSDGDGTGDLTEDSRPETDGDIDGNDILDYLDPGFAPEDTDGDGILDILECDGTFPVDDTCKDSDGDGVPDWQDVDDDNDGVLTLDEYAAMDPEDGDPENDHDWDNDGIPNHLDLDADNDGIPDITENGHGDLDADGDGRADVETDGDMDGLIAAFDADDADAANVMTADPLNTDGTGMGDYLDLDADGDGLLDILEANGSASNPDTDGNGMVDDATDTDMDGLADVVDGSAWPTPDTDEDGTPDFQDTDSDNDGKSDAIEGTDADHDGVADIMPSGTDANGNGIDDIFEVDGNTPSQPDTDMDMIPDWRDVDDDNDGVPSVIEVAAGDTDGDGTPDYLDTDDDGDGILTTFEAPDPDGDGDPADAQDTDGDGIADYLDPDDDGDAIPTIDEMADPNGDGNPEDAIDSDGDGIPDYLDPDNGPITGGGVAGGGFGCTVSAGSSSSAPGLAWMFAALGFIGWRRRRR